MKAVWKESFVDEGNFHVTLHAVRRALGESGRAPNYIVKTQEGYLFTAAVREISEGVESESDVAGEVSKVLRGTTEQELGEQPCETLGMHTHGFRKHIAHAVVSCLLYAALYAAAVPLEVAYRFDRFGPTALKIVPFVFVVVFICSIAGLALDHRLALRGKIAGVLLATSIFLASAGFLFVALRLFLPPFPITLSNLQSYPAQAAYLKDEAYFLVLSILFMILPFHFITMMEREARADKDVHTSGLPTEKEETKAHKRVAYPKPWVLAMLLVAFALLSVAMTAHLIDNLTPGPYMNLFVLLVYLRGILYFGLGMECLIWYWNALSELNLSVGRNHALSTRVHP